MNCDELVEEFMEEDLNVPDKCSNCYWLGLCRPWEMAVEEWHECEDYRDMEKDND